MRIPHILIAVLFGILLPLHQAVADADGEREALARIIYELETREPLIGEATSQANPDARIHFRYEWLRQNLVKITGAVSDFRSLCFSSNSNVHQPCCTPFLLGE